jgi:hypothetical protein
LTCGLLWIAILCAFTVQVKKSSDSPLVFIADFALIQSGLLFLLLPLMWHLRTCVWGRRDIRPLDHLEETVTLPLSRTEFKRTANRETWLGVSILGLALIPPLVVIGFFGFASTEIKCAIFSIWFFGILGFGIWWGLRRDRKVWPSALLEQCPVCRHGGRFRFFRWKSSKPYMDVAFWRTVLKTSRCPHCGCRLRFQDDPEEIKK